MSTPLDELDHASERWMLAGALAIGADSSVGKLRDQLQVLAQKVPALARMHNALAQVSNAANPERARALLDATALATQIRNSRTTHKSPSGTLAPVPHTTATFLPNAEQNEEAIETIVRSLHDYSTTATPQEALFSMAPKADVRLFASWLSSLDDSSKKYEWTPAAQQALQRYAGARTVTIAPIFMAQGDEGSAQWLRSIARLRVPYTDRIVEESLRNTSAAVLSAALEALAGWNLSKASERAKELLAGGSSLVLRSTALRVLFTAAPEATLPMVFSSVEDEALRTTACALLRASTLPNLALSVREAMQKYLEEEQRIEQELQLRREKMQQGKLQDSPVQRSERMGLESKQRKMLTCATALLGVLPAHGEEGLREVVALWKKHPTGRIRLAAGRGLLDSAVPSAIAAVAEALHDNNFAVRELAYEAVLTASTSDAYERLHGVCANEAYAGELLGYLARCGRPLDARWAAKAVAFLQNDDGGSAAAALLATMQATEHGPAVQAELQRRAKERPLFSVSEFIDALVLLHPPGAALTVCNLFQAEYFKAPAHRRDELYDALRKLGGTEAVPFLKARAHALRNDRTEGPKISTLVTALERAASAR